MIQANELRIGNYFKAEPYSFDILQVNALGSQWVIIDNGSLFYKNIQPIPLTEEWLSKFGFKKTNESEEVEWYSLNGFEIATHEEYGKVYFVYQHMVLRHIINVHQLQNLYFALTNNELNIQL